MSGDVNNTTSNNCSLFSDEELMILGLTQGVTAIFSCLGCIFIFILMIIFKKYIYSQQRLIIYLTISVFMVSISFIIRGFGYSLINNRPFCTGIAFFGQYSGGCILASVTCVIVEIFQRAVLNKKWTLEPLYIVCIFGIPLALDWLPFIDSAYGPTRGWCWIRGIDTHCAPYIYGLVMQYLLWFVPSYLILIVGSIIYLWSMVALRKRKTEYTGIIPDRIRENMMHETAVKEISHFKWYPLAYMVVNSVPLAMRIIQAISPSSDIFFLWVISAIVQASQGGFVAVIFSMDAETRKRLKWSQMRNGIKYNVMGFDDTVEYPAIITTESDSRQESLR